MAEATLDDWQLRVLIRADGDHSGSEAYIVLGGSGITDHNVFTIILAAIPGVAPDDWMAEPSAVRGLKPGSGEIVFSACLPPAAQAQLLETDEEG